MILSVPYENWHPNHARLINFRVFFRPLNYTKKVDDR